MFGFLRLTQVTVVMLKHKLSHLIEGRRALVSELMCLPWVQSAACHSFTNSVHYFKNTEGISLRSFIDFHLLAVTENFSALLPANIYFAFFHSTLIKIMPFIPCRSFFVSRDYLFSQSASC